MSTTFTITHPDGTVSTRTGKSRTDKWADRVMTYLLGGMLVVVGALHLGAGSEECVGAGPLGFEMVPVTVLASR